MSLTIKEKVFELIRQEKVTIWIGSGMSKYAGYPDGNQLSSLLYDSLDEEEKNLISKTTALPDLAQEVLDLKDDRGFLINLLREHIGEQRPVSTEYHDLIAKIPHFKTIITTNYDTMIENALGDRCQVLFKNEHYSEFNPSKVLVIKAHGDLSYPDSVVLTKTELSNEILKGDRPNWTIIKERILTNNILFIGYGFEDENVRILFEQIERFLSGITHEKFLVAPGFQGHKVRKLEKRGFNYINSDGETFLLDLMANIKEQIATDYISNIVSVDTYNRFLNFHNLGSRTETVSGLNKIVAVRPLHPEIKSNIKITFKGNEDLIESFRSFAEGESFEKLKLSNDELLETTLSFDGIKLPSWIGGEFQASPIPVLEEIIDIQFDSGKRFSGVSSKIFVSKSLVEIKIYFKPAVFSIKIKPPIKTANTVTATFEHKDFVENLADEISLYDFLLHLVDAKFATVRKEGYQEKFSVPILTRMKPLIAFHLSYFRNLRTIENHWNIRFNPFQFSEISQDTNQLIQMSIARIKQKPLINSNWTDTYTLDFSQRENEIERILAQQDGGGTLVLMAGEPDKIELHGSTYDLGFRRIEIPEPIVANRANLESGNTKKIEIRSSTKTIRTSFSEVSSLDTD